MFLNVLVNQHNNQDGPWHLEKSRLKTEKHNFPVLGALLEKKYGDPKSCSPKVRNFFTFYVLADRMGRKSQNTGFLCHFGLGRPLALEIRGGKQKNTNSHIETENGENPLQVGPNTLS